MAAALLHNTARTTTDWQGSTRLDVDVALPLAWCLPVDRFEGPVALLLEQRVAPRHLRDRPPPPTQMHQLVQRVGRQVSELRGQQEQLFDRDEEAVLGPRVRWARRVMGSSVARPVVLDGLVSGAVGVGEAPVATELRGTPAASACGLRLCVQSW